MKDEEDLQINQVRELAKREGVSINQFAASAIAEKMAAFLTSDCLERRAERGDRTKFETVLARVPDVIPTRQDVLE